MTTRGADGLLNRVNPFAILVGMGFVAAFTWYFSGGGFGRSGSSRKVTQLPQFALGQDIGGQMITGIRSSWEYQVDDQEQWVDELFLEPADYAMPRAWRGRRARTRNTNQKMIGSR